MGDGEISAELRDRMAAYSDDNRSGTLAASDNEGYVGDSLTLEGQNLPADEQLAVVWHTFDGEWGVINSDTVVGPQYRPRTDTLFTVTTDGDGRFTADWTVRQDYGGEHTIEVQNPDGETLASTSYTVKPHFELDRTTVPMGEYVRVNGYGLGPDRAVTSYPVTWDNSYVGYMTGVENRGTTTARIRAVGPPGEHVVQVWRSYEGFPFLQNNTQSKLGPVADGRQSVWTVEVSEPDERPPTTEIDALSGQTPVEDHTVAPDVDTDATLEIEPRTGAPGTDAVLSGRGFPADTEVDLVWYTHVGHRFMNDPVEPEPRPDVLPSVHTDSDGSFHLDVTIPSDIGETRPIVAEVDGRSVAATSFLLQPDIATFSPTEGPVGTEITIELDALGWASYENNYCVLYDNHLVGYFCSHNADDDSEPEASRSRFKLRASGEPGLHFIDVIPTFNHTDVDDLELENRPHLSHRDNHAVRALPRMSFTFEVTE
jgi:hypothetical protein